MLVTEQLSGLTEAHRRPIVDSRIARTRSEGIRPWAPTSVQNRTDSGQWPFAQLSGH